MTQQSKDLPVFSAIPRAYVMYYARGVGPGMNPSISDPPCSGYQSALVYQENRADTRLRVLCHVTLRSWCVHLDSFEVREGQEPRAGATDRILARLSSFYEGYGGRADYGAVCDFLDRSGRQSLTAVWRAALRAQAEARALAMQEAVASRGTTDVVLEGVQRVPGLKPTSRRGQVLEFFASQEGQRGSIKEAMEKLSLDRNGVLSHLWRLNKSNGVKYSLDNGFATVELPS